MKPRGAEAARPGPGTRRDPLILLGIVAALTMLGLMMVLSASSVESLRSYGGGWLFFQRQLAWIVLGAMVLAVTLRVDYRHWQRLALPAVALCFALLVAVLVPGMGTRVSGSTRWLDLGPVRLQPSELAKLAVLIFAAELLARRSDRMDDVRSVLRPLAIVVGVLAVLIMAQPDMGTTMVIVFVTLGLLFAAGLPLGRMLTILASTAVGAVILGLAVGYRRDRITAFLDPWSDVGGNGYQVAQSLVALGSGGLTGVGLGASRAKWGFLPNAHTDFIFSIIGEELGLVGAVTVLGLFAAFTYFGTRTALAAPDRFGRLLAVGVTVWVAGQALVNLGAVTGLLPVTGVPLPLVSFGGSALVVTLGAVGILINVAGQAARSDRPRPRSAAARR